MKKIIFWIFILLALIAAVWAYYDVKNGKRPKVDAISILPDSCLVYLTTTDFSELEKKINSQSLIFDKLKSFEEVNIFCDIIHQLDSLIQSNNLLKEELDGTQIHFALYENGVNWLTTFNIKELGKQQSIGKALSELFIANKMSGDIFTFTLRKSKPYYFTLNSGVVLVSNSRIIVETALRKNTPKFFESKSYLNFKTTLNENNLFSIYINHNLYSQDKVASFLNLTFGCEQAVSAGAFEIEPSELKATGYISIDSTEILSALINQPTQSAEAIMNILPSTVRSFQDFGFGSYQTLISKRNVKPSQTSLEYWSQINEGALYNLKYDFETNIKNHLLRFGTLNNQQYLAVEITDSIKALEHLQLMSDSIYTLSAAQVFRLKKINGSAVNLFEGLFTLSFEYAFYYNSFIVFSKNRADAEALVKDYRNNFFARNDLSFISYKTQNFPDEYNYLFYSSPAMDTERVNAVVKFNSLINENCFDNFKHFSFSLINDKENFKFRWQLLNEPESSSYNQNNLWALKLDSTSSFRPSGFINHLTKENEVVVQDDKNVLHLINAKGKLLWKKEISEKIISEIFMVDAFKNNKYQLLFNTENYIHLIDRNGVYVKGYPVKLAAKATSPLCLLDYADNKDYRLFIGCKNNFIYNYTIQGTLNEGFKNFKTEAEVKLPVQYIKVGGSDYLITVDIDGRIYTFSRKGDPRIKLKNRTIANCKSFYVDAMLNLNSTNLFYLDDKSGAINKISLTDKKEILNLNYVAESTRAKYTLVDDNREMDFITTHEKTISAYNLNGDLLLNKITDQELSEVDFYCDEAHALYYAMIKGKDALLVYKHLKQKIVIMEATSLPLTVIYSTIIKSI